MSSFCDIGQKAFEQQFHNLGSDALSEQENSGDAEDEALQVPINEVERWKKLARKRNAKAQRFLCDDNARFANMLWLHIAAPRMKLHWILFKTCTWYSDRGLSQTADPDPDHDNDVALSLGQFCSGPDNPGYKVIKELMQQLLQPSESYRLLSFFHGPFPQWPQARKRTVLRSVLITLGQLIRKVIEPFLVYPWKLWPLANSDSSPRNKRVCAGALFQAPPCCLDSGCSARIRATMDRESCLEPDFGEFLRTMFERIVMTSTFIERKFSHFSHWTDVKGKGASLSLLAAKHVTRSFKDAVDIWKRDKQDSRLPKNSSRPAWCRKEGTTARLNGYHVFVQDRREARGRACRGAEESADFLADCLKQWRGLTRQEKQVWSARAKAQNSQKAALQLAQAQDKPPDLPGGPWNMSVASEAWPLSEAYLNGFLQSFDGNGFEQARSSWNEAGQSFAR